MSIPILNASGCLDALAAPEVAQMLDAFVTKTVTPLPREGNPPPRIAETESGMLNSIGLQNPGIEAFLAETVPRLRELGIPIWVSVGGFSAADYADCLRAARRAGRGRHDRAEPVVPERRGGARDRGRARLRRPRGHAQAAVREALARDLGHRRVGARSRGRGRRRAVPDQHDPRPRDRLRDGAFEARPRPGRLLGTRASSHRARVRVRLQRGGRPADRRHGRDRNGPRRRTTSSRPARARWLSGRSSSRTRGRRSVYVPRWPNPSDPKSVVPISKQ